MNIQVERGVEQNICVEQKRFKGLGLVDRVPEELWTEVCNTVQETGSKTITKKKKRKMVV